MSGRRITGGAIALLVALLLAGSLAGAALANGVGNCFDKTEDAKYEGVGPHAANAPAGMVITEVAIKTGKLDDGSFCLFYTADSNDGCYVVSGIGTDKVTVERIGDGPDCKEISHIEVKYGPADDENGDTPVNGNGDTPVNGNGDTPVNGDSQTGGEQPIVEMGADVQTPPPASVTALPSTGVSAVLPLAAIGLAAGGFWLRRRA